MMLYLQVGLMMDMLIYRHYSIIIHYLSTQVPCWTPLEFHYYYLYFEGHKIEIFKKILKRGTSTFEVAISKLSRKFSLVDQFYKSLDLVAILNFIDRLKKPSSPKMLNL